MIPGREVATNNGQTYFVTSNTAERKPFFRHERWAKLLLETLYKYRPERYLIHGFVIMPDHFHLLITPKTSLELAVQCLKGGFSFRAKREFKWTGSVWVTGYSDHRIRNEEDFKVHLTYIANNPVKAGLVERAEQYTYSSAGGSFELDAFPQGLKPDVSPGIAIGAPEGAPFQSTETRPSVATGAAKAAPFQSRESRPSVAGFPSAETHPDSVALQSMGSCPDTELFESPGTPPNVTHSQDNNNASVDGRDRARRAVNKKEIQ